MQNGWMTNIGAPLLCLALVLAAPALSVRADEDKPVDVNAQRVKDAWDAFNKAKVTRGVHDWQQAIENANTCAIFDEDRADEVAGELRIKRVKPIEPDAVSKDPKQREEIFARGPYNDIGACLFIKVVSQWEAGAKEEVEKTYSALCKYNLALVLDPPPHDWFWSPARAARTELRARGRDVARCPS